MTTELGQLLERAKALPPMTPAQIHEQRISFIYGQLGGRVSKDEIRRNLADRGITGDACPRCGGEAHICREQAAFPDPEPFF